MAVAPWTSALFWYKLTAVRQKLVVEAVGVVTERVTKQHLLLASAVWFEQVSVVTATVPAPQFEAAGNGTGVGAALTSSLSER